MNNPQTWGQWNVMAQNHGTLRDDPVKPDLIPAKKKRAKTVRPRVDMICVWCGETGADMAVIKRQLGHSKIDTSLTYISSARIKEKVRLLPGV